MRNMGWVLGRSLLKSWRRLKAHKNNLKVLRNTLMKLVWRSTTVRRQALFFSALLKVSTSSHSIISFSACWDLAGKLAAWALNRFATGICHPHTFEGLGDAPHPHTHLYLATANSEPHSFYTCLFGYQSSCAILEKISRSLTLPHMIMLLF